MLNFIVCELQGNIDCWLPKIIYKPKFYEQQTAENKKIKKQNKNILQKIQNATSKYSTAEFIQSWKELQKKMEIKKRQTFLNVKLY